MSAHYTKQINGELPLLLIFVTMLLFFVDIVALAQPSHHSLRINNLQVQHIGVEHGLSQGSIYSIHKDSYGFMWFSSNEGLNRYDGLEVKTYQNISIDTNSLRGNYTNGIVEDTYGNLWVGTEVCLNRYVREQDNFDFVYTKNTNDQLVNSTNYPFYADSSEVWYTNSKEGILIYNFINGEKRIVNDSFLYNRTNYMINSTFRGKNGDIWIRQETGIVRLERATSKVSYYFSNRPDNALGEPLKINCFYQNEAGLIRMGAGNRLLKMDEAGQNYELQSVIGEPSSTISDIREDSNGLLWLGTEQDGLIVFDEQKGIVRQFTVEGNELLKLTNNSAGTVYIDDQYNVWANVDPEGINVLRQNFKAFKSYGEELFVKEDFVSCGVRHFSERADGKIWIVTEKDGTCLFNPNTNNIEKLLRPEVSDLQDRNEDYAFIDSRQRLWVGTYSGFFYLENDDQKITRVLNQASPEQQSLVSFIWSMKETPDGNFIFSTEAGVYYMGMETLEPKLLYPLIRATVQLHLDDNNNLLLSEYHNGFHVINYEDWINDHPEKTSQQFLTEYNVKCFYQNKPHNDYWIGTNNGLLHIYPNQSWTKIDSLKRYTQEHGLPSIYVYGILPDEQNRLWLSTNRGLANLDLETEKITSYVLEDGVQGYEFNTNSYMKASTGELYFGGTNGFNRFDPSQIKKNPQPPLSIAFIDFLVNGVSYQSNKHIGVLDKIELDYSQNTFTINYAAIDYLSGGQNRYRIFLKGYDKSWQEVGQERSVRYTGVPEGTYTFLVDACNRDGVWTQAPSDLEIRIAAPWYRTWWAYLLYLISAVSIFYLLYRYQTRRKLLQMQLNLEKKESERLKEMDQMKNKIYTNISHEFRTPLTVIKGMAGQITNEKARDLIQNNSDNLLSLVNEILDLSKLDSNSLPVHLKNANIIAFLKYLTASLESLAVAKKVNLSFQSNLDLLHIDFDKDKLSKIVSNLLVNAIRFTTEGGQVTLRAAKDQNELLISVEDTGKGIPTDQQELVFNRFHQVKDADATGGTGIGLALVRELTQLLHGTIRLESEVGKGSRFYLSFPILNESVAPVISDKVSEPIPAIEKSILELEPADTNLPYLLIIEDNADVVTYIKTILAKAYNITTANNGIEGIALALEQIPDIIISDVMMPGKDGYEVCATLKQNEKTSHIPIILLTAKAGNKDKLAGLSYGADAYLIKPFEERELLIRLEQLLALRKKLQESYAQIIVGKVHQKELTREDTFLQKIVSKLLNHLDDECYSIDDLAQELQISRSQLYRKIKALTNLSTSIYIRNIRLKQAQKLLLQNKYPISEVAYMVGFKSPAYFSQAYKALFGYAPNQEGS